MKQIDPKTGIGFIRVEEPGSLKAVLLASDFSPEMVDEWLDDGSIYVDGRRQRRDLNLLPGQILRVHTRRKSYRRPSCRLRRIPSGRRIPNSLVLDKPRTDCRLTPTLDNYHDNAKTILETELGIPLFTTHRLDVPTQGLLIFAKTASAQKILNHLFARGLVEKVYRARNEGSVRPGRYVHFINPGGPRAPAHSRRSASRLVALRTGNFNE